LNTLRTALLLSLLPALNSNPIPAETLTTDLLSVRREYNAISAQVDSLVRIMEGVDAKALDASLLPSEELSIPNEMTLVIIFWADDEARIWLNDFLVGETRLTPVEIEIPSLYLRPTNTIRARCWDTDLVESGLLCGLYLRDPEGSLHTVFATDESWTSPEGPASEIIYAHPMPDIPGAKVIWQQDVFGKVEFEGTFSHQDIQNALAGAASPQPSESIKNKMDYHAFVQRLAGIEERRATLKRRLGASSILHYPEYSGTDGNTLSLTLGKAGPLHEDVSAPVAEQVKSWARNLPESQKRLIYPDRRQLKGESAANPAGFFDTPFTSQSGDRQDAYRPPEDRDITTQGRSKTQNGKAGAATSGDGAGTNQNRLGGGLGGGRSSRLGLLLPTLLLTGYVGFVISKWQVLTREA
jgi:hypothetical protein